MQSSPRIDELKQKFHENPRRYFAPLANEYRKAGDPEQAIAICRAHLAQQPGHMSGHVVYGQALYDAGRVDEAEPVFRQALALDPENLVVLRHLGDIARQRGDVREAQSWYSRVLEGDPQDTEVAAYLAELAEPLSTTAPAVSAPAAEARPEEAVTPEEAKQEEVAAPVAEAAVVAQSESADAQPAEEAAAEAEEAKLPRLADDEPIEIASIDEMEEQAPEAAEPENAPEPTEPEPPMRTTPTSESSPFVTRTMAELYLDQGYIEPALEIYKQLAEREPHDEELKDKVAELSRDVPEPFDFEMINQEYEHADESAPAAQTPIAETTDTSNTEEKPSELWDTADSWGADEFAGADADEMFGLSESSFDFATSSPASEESADSIEPPDEQYPSEPAQDEDISVEPGLSEEQEPIAAAREPERQAQELTELAAPDTEQPVSVAEDALDALPSEPPEAVAPLEREAPGAKTPAMEVPLEEEAEEAAPADAESAERGLTVREFFATLGSIRPPEVQLEEVDEAVAESEEIVAQATPEPEVTGAEDAYPYADDAFASLFENAPVDPDDSRAAAALSSAVAHTPDVTTPTESFRYPAASQPATPAPLQESEEDIRRFREWLDSLANS